MFGYYPENKAFEKIWKKIHDLNIVIAKISSIKIVSRFDMVWIFYEMNFSELDGNQ